MREQKQIERPVVGRPPGDAQMTGREKAHMSGLGQAIGDILSPAIGVALSTTSIISVVLMLMSPSARRTAPAFALGVVTGLAVATTIVVLVANPAGADSSDGNTWVGAIKIAIGLLFFLMAAQQWRSRPKEGELPALPAWMATIDGISPVKAFGLGFALSGLNPKNLALAITAALSITQAGLTGGGTTIAVIVFVVLGSLTVTGPVLAYLNLRERVQDPMLEAKNWLVRENATVMFVVFLILGFDILGKGIRAL
jgi:threonine/homoserine/homoserine lactone efflux protein